MTHRRPVPGTQIDTVSDLAHLWEGLMGTDGFAGRSLWVVLLDPESRTLPVLMPIDSLPPNPTPDHAAQFALLIDLLIADVGAGSAALLLSRPGQPGMTDRDRRWATALRGAGSPALRRWPIHLATKGRITAFAPDDLIGAPSGARMR